MKLENLPRAEKLKIELETQDVLLDNLDFLDKNLDWKVSLTYALHTVPQDKELVELIKTKLREKYNNRKQELLKEIEEL